MRFMSRKMAAAGLAGVLLLGGGAAFAIFMTTGTGTGSGPAQAGTAGTANVTLSVHVEGTIVPGATVPVDFDVTNPNSGPVNLTTISLVSVTSTGACGSMLANYPQFTLAPLTVDSSVLPIPAGATNYKLIPSGALTWENVPGLNQSACLGKQLTVNVKTP